MSQNNEILSHLKRGRLVSAIDAVRLFGTTRLAARIYDLRLAGYNIRTRTVTVRTRRGHARVAIYRLYAG